MSPSNDVRAGIGRALAVLALGAVLLSACESTTRKPRADTASAHRASDSTPVPTPLWDTAALLREESDTTSWVMADSLSPAYQQFSKFLELAVATRVPHLGMDDSVYSRGADLGVDEQYADMRWVAAYRILWVSTKGDVGRAAAVITEVARQVDDHDVYRASFGIREDSAHWLLVRGVDSTGRWLVEGDAVEGFGVFHIGRDVRWVSGSRAKALAAVDSIRRARGLPLLR